MAKKRQMSERSGYAFVGCLMLGLAIGMLFNQTAVGVLAGLGLGFLSMALLGKSK